MRDDIDNLPPAAEQTATGNAGPARNMTLRQFYIGQALSAMQIPMSADRHVVERIAQTACCFADAALRELES